MKANELRIGNWVGIGSTHDRDLIELDIKDYENLIIFKTFDRLKPIPLTEDWLVKFGGKKAEFWEGAFFNLGVLKLEIRLYKGNWLAHLRYGQNAANYNKLNPCSYVHQLQNLYFALTGEELKIN